MKWKFIWKWIWSGIGWKRGTNCENVWIGLDLGKAISLKRYDRYRNFIKHAISNREAKLYPKNEEVIEKCVPNLKH